MPREGTPETGSAILLLSKEIEIEATKWRLSITLVKLALRLILLIIRIVAMDLLPARAGLAASDVSVARLPGRIGAQAAILRPV
jgi:hypothetical protein